MEEKILVCPNVEENVDELINRGYEDEGEMFVKSINENSSICIDKETGIVADITNDGISCEGLAEIVELSGAGLISTSQESKEVVEDAKATADGVDE